MIRALGASPVAADTTAAAIRTRHMGSSSLRPTRDDQSGFPHLRVRVATVFRQAQKGV